MVKTVPNPETLCFTFFILHGLILCLGRIGNTSNVNVATTPYILSGFQNSKISAIKTESSGKINILLIIIYSVLIFLFYIYNISNVFFFMYHNIHFKIITNTVKNHD